jgi:molecular chaperone GrpE
MPGLTTGTAGEAEGWREQALRLQAEMGNYRKRQQRLAQEQIEEERRRLLGAFLGVVDDLERALNAPQDGGDGLRQGVKLTHRAAMQLLQKEGVEPISAQNQPFDPNWHEAVATIGRGSDMPSETVVRVMEPGYRLGERLLRPARVIVAV